MILKMIYYLALFDRSAYMVMGQLLGGGGDPKFQGGGLAKIVDTVFNAQFFSKKKNYYYYYLSKVVHI
jgi:hypothetical protein